MPKYMLLIYDDPARSPAQDTPEAQHEFQEYGTFPQQIQEDGAFVAGEPLQPTDTATTVRVNDGEAEGATISSFGRRLGTRGG